MIKKLLSILLLLLLLSCDNIFEYSPYQVKVDKSDKGQNIKNLKKISKINSKEFKTFRIALFGDTHTFYDDFEDIVSELNKRDDYDFIINMGDITLSGINREFIWYSNIINKLKKPVLTIIGNHDYLANGYYVFDEMYGPTNFTFEYNNCKFVIFDDVIWERKGRDPDFNWFDINLKNEQDYTQVISFSHIPPWDQQFSIGNEMYFNYLLASHKVKYSFHGHTHNYKKIQPYTELIEMSKNKSLTNVTYVTTEAANDRGYLILTIEENDINIEKVNF